MYMYVVVCYKHVLEDTDCYGGYLNKSCILYLVSCISNLLKSGLFCPSSVEIESECEGTKLSFHIPRPVTPVLYKPLLSHLGNKNTIFSSKIRDTDLILLDFSKAFDKHDKMNHSKLLWKLHQYGIRGNALAWIRAFLGNRSQTVVIDGEESKSVPVTSGVLQGSVLGPILFLIYINDLPDELSSQVRLFADDTAVYLTIGDTEDDKVLQNDLDRLSVWEDRWDMEFNPSKCQGVRVTTSRRLIDVTYTLHGQVLEVVTSAKYLGLISPVAFPGIPTLTE